MSSSCCQVLDLLDKHQNHQAKSCYLGISSQVVELHQEYLSVIQDNTMVEAFALETKACVSQEKGGDETHVSQLPASGECWGRIITGILTSSSLLYPTPVKCKFSGNIQLSTSKKS